MTVAQLIEVCGLCPRRIRGGRGARLTVRDVDPRQLTAGIRVELEHTRSRRLACEIALDHLAEDRRYYTKLRRARL